MSYRDFDFYRLVVVRHFKQLHVARSFGVTPSRVSQVLCRVEKWVNERVGDWLFPGRDDLRFYVALDRDQIRVREGTNPEHVVIEHVSGTRSYARASGEYSELTDLDPDEAAQLRARAESNSSPKVRAQDGANLSAQGLNFISDPQVAGAAATPSGKVNCAPAATGDGTRQSAPNISNFEKLAEL